MGPLTPECDELWSFVGTKTNKQWLWVTLDPTTRRVIALHVGGRDEAGARALWEGLPEEYRAGATFYTDSRAAYACVVPAAQHVAVGKDSGKTNHVERFNNTPRQFCRRLVRKALSFSKKLCNHIGAIWYFVRHYNNSLRL